MAEDEATQPPGFSLPRVWATIAKCGPFKAMDDEEMGPHVHLTYLLGLVFVLAMIIGGVVYFL